MSATHPSEKQQVIIDAALAKFSAYGFTRTSMADIATAAGMSRPSLYQHYANKEEIFRAMLQSILEIAVDHALEALARDEPLADQLDGFLQHWAGDLTESFRSTEHGSDLIEAKAGHAMAVVEGANKRLRDGLSTHLDKSAKGRGRELAELLILSSIGLKYDEPSIAVLRKRLTGLAHSISLSATSN